MKKINVQKDSGLPKKEESQKRKKIKFAISVAEICRAILWHLDRGKKESSDSDEWIEIYDI